MNTPSIDELAKAAKEQSVDEWYKEDWLKNPINQNDRAFVAACSPEAWLSLSSRVEALEGALKEALEANLYMSGRIDAFDRASRPFTDSSTDDGEEYDAFPDATVIKIECTVADLKALQNAINGDEPKPAEIIAFHAK